jgi:hypothetical protein
MEYAAVIDELNADRAARDEEEGIPAEEIPSYVEQTEAVLQQILGGAEPQGGGSAPARSTESAGSGINQARREAASAASPT